MKKIISGVLAAALVVGLAACSTAYYVKNLTVTIIANGSMNLSNFDDSESHTVIGGTGGASRVLPQHSNNTAKIQLSNVVDGLNANVSGSYADGDVKFNFKGEAEAAGCFGTLCSPVRTSINKIMSGIARSQRSNSEGGRLKVSGSTCVIFPSLYESTNPNMPGTGVVIFNVCDAPVLGATPVGTVGPGTFYAGTDYVTVYIPTLDPGDLNPFANYYSGGTLGASSQPIVTSGAKSGSRQGSQEEDRNSSTSVSILYPATEPTATPTPIWPSPGPAIG
jgi:hypothetical protein